MGSLRRLYLSLTICIAASAATAFPGSGGFPTSPSQRAQAFSWCAGAYMALAEHRAMFDGTVAQIAMTRRDSFADMLEAVSPDAIAHGTPATQLTAYRVQARADLRSLLSAAEFNMIPQRAQPARKAAQAALAKCDQLLLGS